MVRSRARAAHCRRSVSEVEGVGHGTRRRRAVAIGDERQGRARDDRVDGRRGRGRRRRRLGRRLRGRLGRGLRGRSRCRARRRGRSRRRAGGRCDRSRSGGGRGRLWRGRRRGSIRCAPDLQAKPGGSNPRRSRRGADVSLQTVRGDRHGEDDAHDQEGGGEGREGAEATTPDDGSCGPFGRSSTGRLSGGELGDRASRRSVARDNGTGWLDRRGIDAAGGGLLVPIVVRPRPRAEATPGHPTEHP